MRILLAAALLVAFAAPALGSETFPPEIDDTLSLGYEPICTTCHQTLLGGFQTATKPFAVSMRNRGLVAGDLGSLNTALAALDAESTDSDGDGIEDIQELRDGGDPNSAGEGDPPEYGCLGNVAPVRSGWAGAALVIGALALIAGRRRRRAPRSP